MHDDRPASGPDGRDRRRHERIAIRFPVEARSGNATLCRGVSVNLSASGILAALPRDFPLGEEVALWLELPGEGSPLLLRAMPIRIEAPPGGGPPFRLAFHFIQPPGEDLQRVRRVIHEV